MNRDPGTMLDIVLACRDIAEFIKAVDEYQFAANRLVRSAVIHQLLIVGEATKRLSTEFRKQHPMLPWKKMAGMRDKLIHGYDQVDLDLVWSVATTEIPLLHDTLAPFIPDNDEA
ncbi:MAG: DUF86 domain-containing protein [Chloroflexota bacterium]|nr:DUF86 domain-containing protein [Chloroflexota bacterium]